MRTARWLMAALLPALAPAATAEAAPRRPRVTTARFPGYGFIKTNTLVGQLAAIGCRPSDIDYLSFSDLHADHSGNGNLFARSTWLVAKPEYDSAFASKNGARLPGFENYDRLRTARTIMIPADYDVFGGGSVGIKQAFGHSPGHSALAVRLRNTGTVLLAGDLYHYPEERTLHRIGPMDAALGTGKARTAIEDRAAATMRGSGSRTT